MIRGYPYFRKPPYVNNYTYIYICIHNGTQGDRIGEDGIQWEAMIMEYTITTSCLTINVCTNYVCCSTWIQLSSGEILICVKPPCMFWILQGPMGFPYLWCMLAYPSCNILPSMGIYTSGNQTWQLKIHHLYIVFPAINLNLVWGFSSHV